MTDAIHPRDVAVRIVGKLRDAGHVAYFAGGCVRDELLDLHPKDYDVATDAPPQTVRKIFPRTQAVGEHFGVILVRLDGVQIEVATFRNDGSYLDGRRPERVHFTHAEEDAKRRDFTINGLFYDPLADEVIDYVGGQKDLRDDILRCIGDPDARFGEDHLRLLRAVRFAARFGLEIEPATWSAMQDHAPKLKLIAPERVGDELRRMLTGPQSPRAVTLLREAGLLAVVLRGGSEESLRSSFGFVEGASFGGSLAMLAGDADVDQAVRVCRRNLKISNAEADRMHDVLRWADVLQDGQVSMATARRFLAHPAAADTEHLLRSHGVSLPAEIAEVRHLPIAPVPLLTGEDLIAAGWEPGPAFKRVLHDVYDAQLEDRVKTTGEALQLAQEIR